MNHKRDFVCCIKLHKNMRHTTCKLYNNRILKSELTSSVASRDRTICRRSLLGVLNNTLTVKESHIVQYLRKRCH